MLSVDACAGTPCETKRPIGVPLAANHTGDPQAPPSQRFEQRTGWLEGDGTACAADPVSSVKGEKQFTPGIGK
jgi:hypothetical protein